MKPFPEVADTDVTPEMQRQGYTPRRMFELAEEFYASIGLYHMTDTFWNKSIIERPPDNRTLDCHGSAWDLTVPDDFRCAGTHSRFICTV